MPIVKFVEFIERKRARSLQLDKLHKKNIKKLNRTQSFTYAKEFSINVRELTISKSIPLQIAIGQGKPICLQNEMKRDEICKYMYHREIHLQLMYQKNDYLSARNCIFYLQNPSDALVESYLFEHHKQVMYKNWDVIILMFYDLDNPEKVIQELPLRDKIEPPTNYYDKDEYGCIRFLKWAKNNHFILEFCRFPLECFSLVNIYSTADLLIAYTNYHNIFLNCTQYRNYSRYVNDELFKSKCHIFQMINGTVHAFFFLRLCPKLDEISIKYTTMMTDLKITKPI